MTAWKTVPLGEVAEFVRGINFKPEDVVAVGAPGSVACMRTTNVQSEVDLSDVWGVPESFVRRPEQMLGCGDILISSANSWNLVGKCCWIARLPWRASFGGFVSVLRADAKRVEPRFLYRWFSSGRIQATLRSFGRQTTNISNLNFERCLGLPLPLPPLPEQRRIAAILDKADELRAKRRAALAQLDGLAQSVFVEMFGDLASTPTLWRVEQLGECVSEFRYGTSIRSAAEGKPALRIPNVINGSLDITDLKCVPVSDVEFERLRLADGDILFVRTNGNPDFVGRCAVFQRQAVFDSGFPPTEFVFASYLIRARLNADSLTPTFLREFMTSPAGRQALRSRSKTSAGQFNINTEGLASVPVPVPPLALQHEYGRRLTVVQHLQRTTRKSAAGLDALFASLQHRAFRGDL